MKNFKISFASVVLLLAAYMPFENMILKFLPVSDNVYGYLRFLSEIMIYTFFIILVMTNALHGKLLVKTSLDYPFFAFLSLGLVSMLVNHSPIGASLIGLRDIFRYVFLFYIVVNINFTTANVRRLLFLFLAIAGFQGVLAAYQHFFGTSTFWYPRATNLEIAGHSTTFKLLKSTYQGGRELGSAIGTFGDTIPMGNYMLYAISLFAACFSGLLPMNKDRYMVYFVMYILAFFALFCSYSRISVLLGLMLVPLVYLLAGRIQRFTPIAIGVVLVVVGLIGYKAVTPMVSHKDNYLNPKFEYASPVENVLQAFTDQYVDRSASSSRGFVIENVLIPMLKSANLIGYGPDPETSLEKLATRDLPANIPFQNVMNVADVYWLSIFTCYGFIGGGIFVSILLALFVFSMRVFRKSDDMYYKIIAVAFAGTVLLAFPYTVIIRTFVFRVYAFYFWLFAGIVMQEYKRITEREKIEEESFKEVQRQIIKSKSYAPPVILQPQHQV